MVEGFYGGGVLWWRGSMMEGFYDGGVLWWSGSMVEWLYGGGVLWWRGSMEEGLYGEVNITWMICHPYTFHASLTFSCPHPGCKLLSTPSLPEILLKLTNRKSGELTSLQGCPTPRAMLFKQSRQSQHVV